MRTCNINAHQNCWFSCCLSKPWCRNWICFRWTVPNVGWESHSSVVWFEYYLWQSSTALNFYQLNILCQKSHRTEAIFKPKLRVLKSFKSPNLFKVEEPTSRNDNCFFCTSASWHMIMAVVLSGLCGVYFSYL